MGEPTKKEDFRQYVTPAMIDAALDMRWAEDHAKINPGNEDAYNAYQEAVGRYHHACSVRFPTPDELYAAGLQILNDIERRLMPLWRA